MNLSTLLPLLSMTCVLLLGVFVFAQKQKTATHYVFLAFSVTVFIWMTATFMLFRSQTSVDALFWDRIAYLAVIFIPSILLHFSVVLSRSLTTWRLIYTILGYALSLIFIGLLFFTEYFLVGVYEYSWGVHAQAGYVHSLFLVFFTVYLGGTFHILYRAQKSHKVYQEKLKIQFISFAIGVLSLGSIGFLPAYGFDVFPFAYITGVLFTGIVAYAILRHGLLEIRTFSTQIFVFFIVAVSLVEMILSEGFTEKGLRLVFFIAVSFAGYLIVSSAQREIQQKEKIQKTTDSLISMNKRLRELDAAKSEFVSIASHQLRTPLTAIKGYISLMSEGSYGKIPVPIQGAFKKIYFSNERIIQLVEELLNISRIESGRMSYQAQVINITEIIEPLQDLFILRTQDKGLAYSTHYPDIPPMVKIDPSKVREVFSNLIDNAVKYTDKGFVKVMVDIKGDVVRVRVQDSGIGVPSTMLEDLFRKFNRGEDQSRLHVEGTGLGLYVGKNIVEANGGKIYVDSKGMDKGSTFIVEFPYVQPSE